MRNLVEKLAWIAGGTAISRVAVAVSILAASATLPLADFGLVGIYLAIALMAMQAVGYSVSLFVLKSGNGLSVGRLKVVGFVAATSVLCAVVFALLCAIFVKERAAGYVAAFFFYVAFGCAHQSFVAFHQAAGDFRKPTAISGAVITTAALLAICAGWLWGAIPMITTISVGYLCSSVWLAFGLSIGTGMSASQRRIGRIDIASEVGAISTSGLVWGGFASWLISDLSRSSGLESAAIYAFGAQFRAALIFIPGVFGVYLTSAWARDSRIDQDKRKSLWRAAFVSAALVAVVGSIAAACLLALKDSAGLDAIDARVISASLMGGVVVSVSTPSIRWISVHYGDWSNASISTVAVIAGALFTQLGESTPVWMTMAFVAAYVVQATLSLALVSRNERSRCG